jgi:hypothetical protein
MINLLQCWGSNNTDRGTPVMRAVEIGPVLETRSGDRDCNRERTTHISRYFDSTTRTSPARCKDIEMVTSVSEFDNKKKPTRLYL